MGDSCLARNFDEWRNELLIAASDDALVRWYTHPEERPTLQATLEADLVRLHSLYPDLVDEACIIDATGPELARQVFGEIASASDLSPDESESAFFAPSFSLAPGEVHQHSPYISADSGRWVISNSTPVAVGGKKVVLFHFETSIEGLRQRLAKLVGSRDRARIIDVRTGRLIADTGGAAVKAGRFVSSAKASTIHGTRSSSAPGAMAPGASNDWRVEVFVPRTSALAGSALKGLTLLVLVAIGILAALALRAARSITRPVARMTETAR